MDNVRRRLGRLGAFGVREGSDSVASVGLLREASLLLDKSFESLGNLFLDWGESFRSLEFLLVVTNSLLSLEGDGLSLVSVDSDLILERGY